MAYRPRRTTSRRRTTASRSTRSRTGYRSRAVRSTSRRRTSRSGGSRTIRIEVVAAAEPNAVARPMIGMKPASAPRKAQF